jgi:hypothetical protein
MSSSDEEEVFDIDRPLVEYNCIGNAIFPSRRLEVRFNIQQSIQGVLSGKICFYTNAQHALQQFFERTEEFTLEGIDNNRNQNLRADHCILTSKRLENGNLVAEFIATEVLVNPESLNRRLTRPVLLRFYVTNMYRTLYVAVDTTLGKLYIHPFQGFEKLERMMRFQGISLATAAVHIYVQQPNDINAEKLLDQGVDVIHRFLQITRLAQTCWHDWCNVSIYEEISDHNYQLVALKSRLPSRRVPRSRGITNEAHSSIFMRSAYAGYRNEFEAEFGFDTAVHWYIESNTTSVLEFAYIHACTALEVLTDRFAKRKKQEFILSDKEFGKLRKVLEDTARKWMKNKGVENMKRSFIYQKLSALNRPSFESKIKDLLEALKIKYDDIGLDIGKIVHIRNQITHTGTAEYEELMQEYNKLYVLLTRIFLAILHYQGQYFDWIQGGWKNFSECLID